MILVLSPLVRVRWHAARIEITADDTVSTTDSEVLEVLHAFATPRSVESVGAAFPRLDVPPLVAELVGAGVLVTPDRAGSVLWDGDALAFHRRSRRAEVGGGRAPVSPPVAPARPGATFPLDRPAEAAAVPGPGRDLPALLDARVSQRVWGPGPVRGLGAFLWLSARNRSASGGTVARPYPSGGAAHSLEIYPVVAPGRVPDLPAGIHHYCPDRHVLEAVRAHGHDQVLAAAGAAAGSRPPPVVLVVTSRFERVASSYGELAYSLVLKEVGGLFQTMYLVAAHLGLAVCALGGGCAGSPAVTGFEEHEQAEPVVGELALGPPAA